MNIIKLIALSVLVGSCSMNNTPTQSKTGVKVPHFKQRTYTSCASAVVVQILLAKGKTDIRVPVAHYGNMGWMLHQLKYRGIKYKYHSGRAAKAELSKRKGIVLIAYKKGFTNNIVVSWLDHYSVVIDGLVYDSWSHPNRGGIRALNDTDISTTTETVRIF